MNRILIARMSAIGDIVHSLPAVAALRRAFPEAKIGWIIEERWSELLTTRSALGDSQRSCRKPLVDVIHLVDTRAWRANPLASAFGGSFGNLRRELRQQDYEVAIDLQAAIRSALVNRLSGAAQRFGFAAPRESLAKLFYTRSFETPAVHVVDQGRQLTAAISGVEAGPAEFPLPGDEEAERWAQQKAGGGNYVIISPGAGWGAKRWPAQHYGEVAHALADNGFAVFINAGPGEERLASDVMASGGDRARAFACSLTQLMALIRRARLFIGGDTGPVHLAAACGVPVVAIYGPTDPARNGPYAPGGDQSRIAVLRSPASRTSHARKSHPEKGLLQIAPDKVIAAARELLQPKP